MKFIIAEIDRLTNLLYENINASKVDDMQPMLDKRFKLLKDLLKTKEAAGYLIKLLENDKIIMQKIRDEQIKSGVVLRNMGKLSSYNV